MADAKDSALDKAEEVARRILERLGSKVDSKLASTNQQTLSPHAINALASRIEQVIESNRREDEQGVRRVAPNRFKLLFTYEETSTLSQEYIEAVGKELTATIFEYINNRRYVTRGPVEVQASRDLFTKTTSVKAGFDGDQKPLAPASSSAAAADHTEAARSVRLVHDTDRRNYRVQLKADGAPTYVGRTAENAIRIDDQSVSRLHCSLALRSDGSVVIADLGSANGTYVNGQLLGRDEARPLKLHDVVGIGDFKLTVSEIS